MGFTNFTVTELPEHEAQALWKPTTRPRRETKHADQGAEYHRVYF